jgi:hypothetical protein
VKKTSYDLKICANSKPHVWEGRSAHSATGKRLVELGRIKRTNIEPRLEWVTDGLDKSFSTLFDFRLGTDIRITAVISQWRTNHPKDPN